MKTATFNTYWIEVTEYNAPGVYRYGRHCGYVLCPCCGKLIPANPSWTGVGDGFTCECGTAFEVGAIRPVPDAQMKADMRADHLRQFPVLQS